MSNSVFIFIPAFGQQITAATFLTSHAVMQRFNQKGIAGGVATLSFPDIAELRAMAMTIWYDTLPNVSHLLFVDADMGFPPELVTDMLAFGEPLVGTLYPQRRVPLSWAGSGTGEAHAERRGDFMLVEGVGMGCTLIHRSVVTKMLEVMPEMVDTRIEMHPMRDTLRNAGANRLIRAFEKLDLPERGMVSEDLSFCLRWAQCGGQTWAAVGHRISHVGPYDYAGRYLDQIEAIERAQQQAQEQAQLQAQQPVAIPEVVAPSIVPDLVPAESVDVDAFLKKAEAVPVKRRRGRPRKNGAVEHATA